MLLDGDDHLALDEQIVVERQLVLRQVDHALDRVLDRHEAQIDLTRLDGTPLDTSTMQQMLRSLGCPWEGDGHIYAGEVQYNTTLPKLFNTRVVAGSQVRRDVVSSKQVWLTDALTKEDIQLNQVGVYAQTETPVNEFVKLVFGARYDNPEFYDPQFSPKAALLLSPNENSTFRLTFNRAFKSPSILQTSFFFRDFSPSVGVFGNKDGTTIKNATGTTLRTFAPVVPEVNNTIELGYKGVIKDRLYIDVAGYVARYKSFLSPLVVVANPYTGNAATATYAYNTATNTKYVNASGGSQTATGQAVKNSNTTMNKTFDLWSYGGDETNADKTDVGSKQNLKFSGKWIKNW